MNTIDTLEFVLPGMSFLAGLALRDAIRMVLASAVALLAGFAVALFAQAGSSIIGMIGWAFWYYFLMLAGMLGALAVFLLLDMAETLGEMWGARSATRTDV